MLISRSKPAIKKENSLEVNKQKNEKSQSLPSLESFLSLRDYAGAICLLEFQTSSHTEKIKDREAWLGYCAFHSGDYKRAMMEFRALIRTQGHNKSDWINLACCYFYLGMYNEAKEAADRFQECKLGEDRCLTRLRFHLAHKFGDEKQLMNLHQKLVDVIEDELSLASIHYLRSHYQEAIDIYKRVLLKNREYLALNVYVALCYYKLDYYDVSHEVLSVYLHHFPDSVIALNLKSCNQYKLYNGKAAEKELKVLQEHQSGAGLISSSFGHDLIAHNLVVFRNGESALQILLSLVDVIPEARLNLVIYYLNQNDVNEAFQLIKDLKPSLPQEYILKAVVYANIAQETGSSEHAKIAQQLFQLVGGSAGECDTIPGRQCMAACFFLLKQFDDVLLYLNSIKSYFYNDDTFNFNYAQAKASVGCFQEAEELFLQIQSDKIRSDYTCLSWLARCYIMNGKSRLAWEIYLKMETSAESFALLQLIANECYKMGHFFYAAKSFDMLERLDPTPEYWEGKRGSIVGFFQKVLADDQQTGTNMTMYGDILDMLETSTNPQGINIKRIMTQWMNDNDNRKKY